MKDATLLKHHLRDKHWLVINSSTGKEVTWHQRRFRQIELHQTRTNANVVETIESLDATSSKTCQLKTVLNWSKWISCTFIVFDLVIEIRIILDLDAKNVDHSSSYADRSGQQGFAELEARKFATTRASSSTHPALRQCTNFKSSINSSEANQLFAFETIQHRQLDNSGGITIGWSRIQRSTENWHDHWSSTLRRSDDWKQ